MTALLGCALACSARGPAPPPTAANAPLPALATPVAGELVRQTTRLRGRDLALRSNGVDRGGAWLLDANGYVGTYVQLSRPAEVLIQVRASGFADQAELPRMNVVVANTRSEFQVSARLEDYQHACKLPPGTHFVRVELVNAPPSAHRELIIESLSVTSAQVANQHSDENALRAADTYVENYRKGRARLVLRGAPANTSVQVVLKRHAFNFGVNIPYATNRLLPPEAEAGSDAAEYQRLVLERFNMVVLSNGGKWLYHEEKRDRVDLEYVDRFLDFAARSGLRARMHTLLWDTSQQPAWVASEERRAPGLLTRALAGDAAARSELDDEIAERIDYYVRERAQRYLELDVLNESLHRPRYYRLYGADGIARIFNDVQRAAEVAQANTRLYLNEYNVLQWSTDPLSGAPDPYANWYRRHAERILAAPGKLDGLGVQYYADGRTESEIGSKAHSAARVHQVLQNLSVSGLRLSLTEFSVASRHASPERAAEILEQVMRLVFGTAQADSFLIWAIWAGAAEPPVPSSALFDPQRKLTACGARFDSLMKGWSTALELSPAGDGSVEFNGFFGDYEVRAGDTRLGFSLVPGTAEYTLDLNLAGRTSVAGF